MPKKRKPSKELQRKYLEAYFECGGIQKRACEKIGIERKTAWNWEQTKEFREMKAEWEQYIEESILASLIQRAVKKDNTAAFFMLKSIRPERYDDAVRKLKYMEDNNIEQPINEVKFTVTDARELLDTSNGLGSKANK